MPSASPLLKKLVFKGQSPVLVLGSPPEFDATVFGVPVQTAAKGSYGFMLAFVRSLAEASALGKQLKKAIAEEGVLWIAYPKGTSKKYKGVDVNRDKLNAHIQEFGFEGVSMVAIDDDWAAMRFKRMA